MPGHVTPVLRRQKKEDEGFKAHLGYMDIITNKETKKYKKKKQSTIKIYTIFTVLCR